MTRKVKLTMSDSFGDPIEVSFTPAPKGVGGTAFVFFLQKENDAGSDIFTTMALDLDQVKYLQSILHTIEIAMINSARRNQ